MKIITKMGDQYESNDPLAFQQGGQVAGNGMVYFSNYRGIDSRPIDQGTQKSTKDKKDKDLIDNSLIKELVGKGITSDVNASVQDLVDMQVLYSQLEDTEKTSREGIMLLNQMLMLSTKVNALLRNAELFKTVQQKAVLKDALSEIAVTNNGLILQGKNGRIGQITPEEFALLSAEEKQNFRTLSNAELINEREYNILLLNDTQTFELLNNSTGFTDIQKQISDIMGNITSSKSSQTYDAYTDPSGKLKEGLEQLKKISSQPIDNIITTLSKDSNDSSAQLALDAMWSTLNENSKTYLKSKAALRGLSKEQLEDVAKSYLIKLISPKVKNDTEQSIKVDLGAKDKKGSGSEGSGEKGDLKFWDAFANSAVNMDMQLLSPDGGAYAFTVPMAQYGPLRTREQNPYEKAVLGQISELGSIVNKDSGSFGGEMVLSNALQQGIAYNGDSVARVRLPYKTSQGKTVPDFEMIKNYELLAKEINRQEASGKKLSAGQKMEIYKANGITNLTINGEPANTKEFLAIPVYVGESTYDILDESSQKYLKQEDNDGLQLIMLETFANSKAKVSSYSNLFEEGDDVYKGIMYFPVDEFAGSLKGLLNDGGITMGQYRTRQETEQSRRGWLNQGASGYFNINLLNSIPNVGQ